MTLLLAIRADSEYYNETLEYLAKSQITPKHTICHETLCDITYFEQQLEIVPTGLMFILDELIPQDDYFAVFVKDKTAKWQGKAKFDVTLSFNKFN